MGKLMKISNKRKNNNNDEDIEIIFTLEFKHDMISMKHPIDSYSEETQDAIVHAINTLVTSKFVSLMTSFKFEGTTVSMRVDDFHPVDKEEYAELMEHAPNQVDIDELKCEFCEDMSCKGNKTGNKTGNKQKKIESKKKKELTNKLKDLPQMIISTDNTIN